MRVVDLRIVWIEILRDQPLFEHPVDRIFVKRLHIFSGEAGACGDAFDEAMRIVDGNFARRLLAHDQRVVAPDRHAVAPPIERKGPARDRLAGVPFALAVMQQAARREAIAQPADQFVGANALGRAERVGVPFGALIIVD